MQKVAKPDLANYLDDTLLGSQSGEEHLSRLRKVFQARREAGLLLKPKLVLGKELASFLGVASYYGGFLPGFSARAASLPAVKNNSTITWTPEMEDNLFWIRDSFKVPRVYRPPNWEDTSNSPFILTTDCSATRMGCT